MNIQGTYKLVASEPEKAFEARIVEFIKTFKLGEREDFIWAKAIPHFKPPTFSINENLEFIMLGTRHFGYSLLEIKEFPIHVYVCAPKLKEDFLADNITPSEVSILNWAMLLDKNDERSDIQSIFENEKTIISYTINNIR